MQIHEFDKHFFILEYIESTAEEDKRKDVSSKETKLFSLAISLWGWDDRCPHVARQVHEVPQRSSVR